MMNCACQASLIFRALYRVAVVSFLMSSKNVLKVGDFHDTIQIGLEEAAGTELTTRFQTITFNGSIVLHCHILAHEDRGMMGVVEVRCSLFWGTEMRDVISVVTEFIVDVIVLVLDQMVTA